MLTGGIALISYLRLSTTTNGFQLSGMLSIARTKLSTYNFHSSCNSRITGTSWGRSHFLFGGNLTFSEGFCFQKMETVPVKDLDQTFSDTERRPENNNTIAHADWLNEHQSADAQYEYVRLQNFKDSADPELLWRYGRACHCYYTYSDGEKEAKAAAIWDGLSAVEKAVHIDSQNSNAFVVRHNVTCMHAGPLLYLP